MKDEEKVMTIEEYKKMFISLVQDMEEKHGCKITQVRIEADDEWLGLSYRRYYKVDIEI